MSDLQPHDEDVTVLTYGCGVRGEHRHPDGTLWPSCAITRPMSKYLRFDERMVKGRKTPVVEVYSASSGDLLGRIAWWGAWRQFTFQPEGGTVWNIDCMATITDYIGHLRMAKRRTDSVTASGSRTSDA